MTISLTDTTPVLANLPLVQIQLPKIIDPMRDATNEFHEWIEGCWKKVYLKNNQIIQTEYHFPDETIIHIPHSN